MHVCIYTHTLIVYVINNDFTHHTSSNSKGPSGDTFIGWKKEVNSDEYK